MGWGSGSILASKIETIMKRAIDRFTPEEIDKMGREFAEAFSDMDCDTLHECDGFIGDAENRMTAEGAGAPENPKTGDEYEDEWDGTMRFDGKRWQPVDDG